MGLRIICTIRNYKKNMTSVKKHNFKWRGLNANQLRKILPFHPSFSRIKENFLKFYKKNNSSFLGSPLMPVPHAFSFLSNMRGKPRRGMLRRAVFSDMQRKGLEKMFQKQKYISKPDRKKLAAKLGLKDSQVYTIN